MVRKADVAHDAIRFDGRHLGDSVFGGLAYFDDEAVRLVNVLAFPNPFRDSTNFCFELTDPGTVEVRVFTTSGREIWRRAQRFPEPLQGSIKWDGVDLLEDRLANGTYLYRLEAHLDRAGAPTLRYTGKVVIMR